MNRKGFTLVEIMAVVALIAILSVATIIAVTSIINRQRVRTATLSEKNINEAALSIQSEKHNLYLPACIDKDSGTYVNINEALVKKINDDLRAQMEHDGKTTREQKETFIKNYIKTINSNEEFKKNFSNDYLKVKDINCFKATSVTDMIKEGYLKDLDNGCDTSTLIIIYNKGDSANTAGNLKAVQENGICNGSESEEKGPLITVSPEKDLRSTAKKTVKITATADESNLESNLVLKYGWSKSLRKKPASWETVNLVGDRTKVSAEVSKTGADEEFYLWIAAGSVKDNKGYSNVTFATGPYAFLPTPMIIYASRNYDETFNDPVRGHNRCNGETTCHDKTKVVVYSKPYGKDVDGYIENLCVPSCRGYAFTGWKYNDLNINNNSIVGDRNNHTLTATYTPKTYTVTYNSNGGNTCSPSNKTVTYDKPYGALCVTTRVGYEFMGWWTTADGGTKITDTSIYTVDSNQTIYAHWKAKNYTVLLNSTGATTPGSPSTVVTYDSDLLNPVPNSPSKTYTVYFNTNGTGATANATSKTSNYNFDGWYTATSGGVKVIGSNKKLVNEASGYTQSGKWKRDGGATLYSRFVGGTIATSLVNKNGYNCRWNTLANGSGTFINSGGNYTPTNNTTLYAICNPVGYPITYNLNGGALPSGRTNPSSYTIETNTFTLVNPLKANFSFQGWTGSNGSVPNPAATIPKGSTGAKSYTANWCRNCAPTSPATCTLNLRNCSYITTCPTGYIINNNGKYNPSCTLSTFTVKYSASGASNVPGTQTKKYNIDLKLSTKKPTKANYTFSRWEDNNDGRKYNPGGTYTKNKSTTMIAHWCRNCAPSGGATCKLNASNCTYTTACPSGYIIVNNGKYNPSCKRNTFTIKITYDSTHISGVTLDGSSDSLSKTVVYGTVVTISATSKDYHRFTKWSDGDTTKTNRKVVVTGDTTIKALGVENELKIHYRYGNADKAYKCGPSPKYCDKSGGSKELIPKKSTETILELEKNPGDGTQIVRFSSHVIKVWGTNGRGKYKIVNGKNDKEVERCWYIGELGSSKKIKDKDDTTATDDQMEKYFEYLGVSDLKTKDMETNFYPVITQSCPTKPAWE